MHGTNSVSAADVYSCFRCAILGKSTTVVAVLSDNTGARWIDHAQECRELPQRFY